MTIKIERIHCAETCYSSCLYCCHYIKGSFLCLQEHITSMSKTLYVLSKLQNITVMIVTNAAFLAQNVPIETNKRQLMRPGGQKRLIFAIPGAKHVSQEAAINCPVLCDAD